MKKAFIGTFFKDKADAENFAKRREKNLRRKFAIISAGSKGHFVLSLGQFEKLK